ncbi:PGAP1-like alpha/beta domain-containing protein [Enterovibrio coralii]|uniref:PGAP1-like alpha/beta domain-containing protein n=1 Tax=Enterovibrio coralii TaxID=294935 RepID=UPI000A571853|nr:alpha/beta hydrolase [Enterovibrio coralii]
MKIILLHGLYMHGIAMHPLSGRLEEAGHDVLNLSYNTVKPDLPALFGKMDAFINGEETAIVAHSMGGVICRTYLESGAAMAQYVTKVVTLGTPHKGSQVAAFFQKVGIGDFMFMDASKYLLPDHEPSWPKGSELYSIAGDLSIGPATVLNRGVPSDGTVLIEETKIDGMYSMKYSP